jgi:hypothetical protein
MKRHVLEITCDGRCGNKFIVPLEGGAALAYPERMADVALAEAGWRSAGSSDICPECAKLNDDQAKLIHNSGFVRKALA